MKRITLTVNLARHGRQSSSTHTCKELVNINKYRKTNNIIFSLGPPVLSIEIPLYAKHLYILVRAPTQLKCI